MIKKGNKKNDLHLIISKIISTDFNHVKYQIETFVKKGRKWRTVSNKRCSQTLS